MKKIALNLSLAASIVGLASLIFTSTGCTGNGNGQNGNADSTSVTSCEIAYIDMDRILKEDDFANDRMSVVQTKAASVEQEINRRGSKCEKDQKAFQDKINKGILTQSMAEVQLKKLQEDQAAFENYAAGKQREINEELVVAQNEILDAINTYIQAFNEKAGYQMILATQSQGGVQTGIISIPVVAANPALNITDIVLEGLNAEYVNNKAKAE